MDLQVDPSGDCTSVIQEFRHGPNYSFIRLWVEEQPERAAEIVNDRMDVLRADMKGDAGKYSTPVIASGYLDVRPSFGPATTPLHAAGDRVP